MIHFFRRPKPKPTPNASGSQANRLRDLMAGVDEPDSPRVPLIVVAGCKGGVGTTTIAAALATAFHGELGDTLAIDANLRLPNLGRLLGVDQDADRSVLDVMSSDCTLEEASTRSPDGPLVVAGAWSAESTEGENVDSFERLIQAIDASEDRTSAVVVDAGAGYSAAAAPLWRRATAVLLVTTPGELPLLGAYAAIKLASADGPRPSIRLLANRTRGADHQRQICGGLQATCQRFLGADLPLAGRIDEGRADVHAALLARRLIRELSLSPSATELVPEPAAA